MNRNKASCNHSQTSDYGPNPLIIDVSCAAKKNSNFRTALWTGKHLQVTLMCIPEGESIGLERHENLDQYFFVESGCARVRMGTCKDALNEGQRATDGTAILIPACTWHNITSIGSGPLKLYSIYAPVQHPFGTVQATKRDAQCDEQRR